MGNEASRATGGGGGAMRKSMTSLQKRSSQRVVGAVRQLSRGPGPNRSQARARQQAEQDHSAKTMSYNELVYILDMFYDTYDPEGLDDGSIDVDAIASWTLRQPLGLEKLDRELDERFDISLTKFMSAESPNATGQRSYGSLEDMERSVYRKDEDYSEDDGQYDDEYSNYDDQGYDDYSYESDDRDAGARDTRQTDRSNSYEDEEGSYDDSYYNDYDDYDDYSYDDQDAKGSEDYGKEQSQSKQEVARRPASGESMGSIPPPPPLDDDYSFESDSDRYRAGSGYSDYSRDNGAMTTPRESFSDSGSSDESEESMPATEEDLQEVRDLLERFFLRYDPSGLTHDLEEMVYVFQDEGSVRLNMELFKRYGKNLTVMLREEAKSRSDKKSRQPPRKKSSAERLGVHTHSASVLKEIKGARDRLQSTEKKHPNEKLNTMRKVSIMSASLDRKLKERRESSMVAEKADEVSRSRKKAPPAQPSKVKRAPPSMQSNALLDSFQIKKGSKGSRSKTRRRNDKPRDPTREQSLKRTSRRPRPSSGEAKPAPKGSNFNLSLERKFATMRAKRTSTKKQSDAPVNFSGSDSKSGACKKYELDMTGKEFGSCKTCGRPRKDHYKTKPKITPTLERRWKRGNLPMKKEA